MEMCFFSQFVPLVRIEKTSSWPLIVVNKLHYRCSVELMKPKCIIQSKATHCDILYSDVNGVIVCKLCMHANEHDRSFSFHLSTNYLAISNALRTWFIISLSKAFFFSWRNHTKNAIIAILILAEDSKSIILLWK